MRAHHVGLIIVTLSCACWGDLDGPPEVIAPKPTPVVARKASHAVAIKPSVPVALPAQTTAQAVLNPPSNNATVGLNTVSRVLDSVLPASLPDRQAGQPVREALDE